MQAKDHLLNLKQAWLFIVVFGLVVAAIALGIARQRPASYAVVQAYEIQLANRTVTPDYQYGSYYDFKGAELFTQHVMSLLRSPAVIERIYQTAAVGYTIDNISQFTNQFRTDQGSSQQLQVTFSRYSAAEAEALATAMTTVLTEEVGLAALDQQQQSLFTLHAYEPVIVYQETNILLVTIVALLAGWLMAITLVYIRRYLQ